MLHGGTRGTFRQRPHYNEYGKPHAERRQEAGLHEKVGQGEKAIRLSEAPHGAAEGREPRPARPAVGESRRGRRVGRGNILSTHPALTLFLLKKLF